MSKNRIRVTFEELRSLAFGGIGAAYAAVGTAFEHPVRMLKVQNDTDVNLIVSYDGVTDHDFVAAGSAWIHDYDANKTANAFTFEQAKGDRVWVKEESAVVSSGNVYVTVIYAGGN